MAERNREKNAACKAFPHNRIVKQCSFSNKRKAFWVSAGTDCRALATRDNFDQLPGLFVSNVPPYPNFLLSIFLVVFT
jgi:hypothetical protein